MASAIAESVQVTSVRVVVANGEPLFGDAVERVVRQCTRFQLVAQATDGDSAIEHLRTLKPDVAVLGPSLPGLDGRKLLALAKVEQLPTRLLFVDDDFDDETTYDLLGGGAVGVLAKTASREQLRDAILAAAEGREFLTGDRLSAITREIRLRTRHDRPILSQREREILQRIAKGENAVTIARAMHLGLSTVKTHRAHLYDKLGVSDRAAAVAVSMRRGLIE
jgi:two-component system, NarL family, nitrate/nitrite response regulator NarL